MKKLPIGIQTFRYLIEEDYIYVDKTEQIRDLFAEGGKYYFLSRPRRFGKSLLISTLKELFSGSRELFKDLWIYDKIDWKSYPVIHIDFSGLQYTGKDELKKTLDFLVDRNAERYQIKLKEKDYDKKFFELIRELAKIEKVVILVDEYDKPIIDFVDKKETAKDNRYILQSFYSMIKGADEYLKFVFITGVSKFSKVSVFSGLNNLNDITVDERFSTMLGYTEEEIPRYFGDRLQNMVVQMKIPVDDLKRKIAEWYNGYSWDGIHRVYNPFSVLTFFDKREFGNYWFTTATPTFLVKLIKEYNVDVKEYENYRAGGAIFDSFEIEKINLASLLFQTGYLTIMRTEPMEDDKKMFYLSYPNREVKTSFLEHLLSEFSNRFADEVGVIVYDLKANIKNGEWDKFFQVLKTVFASIPYNIFIKEKEAYYHTVLYLVFTLMGLTIRSEQQTNLGRIDIVVEKGDKVYIMEFKMGSAQEALAQIRKMKYYEKYQGGRKEIILIGVGFDPEKRNIGNYLLEAL